MADVMMPEGPLPAGQSEFSPLYELTTGRRLFALQEMQPIAESVGAGDILESIETALQINRFAQRLEGQWRHSREVNDQSRKRASQLDNKVDRAVGAIHAQLKNIRSVYEGMPRGRMAAAILQELFPNGAGAITRMKFEDELSAIDYLLDRVKTDWGDDLEQLGIQPAVERLTTLAEDFREALGDSAERKTDWDEVRAVRKKGQEALLHVVTKVLANFGTDDPTDVEVRSRLLAPIREQNDRVADLYSRNRGVPDVDPETGEEETPEENVESGREDGGESGDASDVDNTDTNRETENVDESEGDGGSETDPAG